MISFNYAFYSTQLKHEKMYKRYGEVCCLADSFLLTGWSDKDDFILSRDHQTGLRYS